MTEKKLYNRIKAITASAVVLLAVLVLWVSVQFVQKANLRATEQKYLQALETTQAEADSLQAEIDKRNSRAYIEQYGREYLEMAYPDEYRYTVQDKE